LSLAAYFGIVYIGLSAAAQTDALFAFAVTCEDEVFEYRMRYGSGCIVVFIIVRFDEAVAVVS